jgi:hypothetical protein
LKAKIKETMAEEGVNQKYSVSEKIFVSRLPPLRRLPKATGYTGGLLLPCSKTLRSEGKYEPK